MEKFEFRRLALKKLVESPGRGGIAHVARAIGRTDSYVSRMLYPVGKAGRKNIGEDLADAITRHFPYWLDLSDGLTSSTNPPENRDRWPFASVKQGVWLSLSERQKGVVEGYLKKMIEELLAEQRGTSGAQESPRKIAA